MAAELLGRPLLERGAVQPDGAADRQPCADQRAYERRFARAAGADNAQPITCLQPERDALHDCVAPAGRRDRHILDAKIRGRRRQLHREVLGRQRDEQLVEPAPALARGDKAAPLTDGLLHRRKRARRDDRGRDDDAGARLLLDNEISADREHQRLHQEAQCPRRRGEAAADICPALAGVHEFAVCRAPDGADPSGHAHGVQDLGVAPRRLGERVALEGQRGRGPNGLPGKDLGGERHRDQDDAADRRRDAEGEVKEKADHQVERHPGQIEQCRRPDPGQERSHLVKILDRLQPPALIAAPERQTRHEVVDAPGERVVDDAADADQDASADQIEQAVTRVENCRDDNKPDQGRNAAARQHAVIHFEHEEGAGQRQDVERAAHDPDAGKSAAAAPKGGGQL